MKISLRHFGALMVEDGTFSHKIDYIPFFRKHLGSGWTADLLNVTFITSSGGINCSGLAYFFVLNMHCFVLNCLFRPILPSFCAKVPGNQKQK